MVWKFLGRMFDSYFDLLLLMLHFGLVGDSLNYNVVSKSLVSEESYHVNRDLLSGGIKVLGLMALVNDDALLDWKIDKTM